MEIFLKKMLGNLWLLIQLSYAYRWQSRKYKVGKDADIVLWNNNPLSIYANRENLIEGLYIMMFKRWATKSSNRKRKKRVNRSSYQEKNKGAIPRTKAQEKKEYHCDTLELE
jgi:hypothetical protein